MSICAQTQESRDRSPGFLTTCHGWNYEAAGASTSVAGASSVT
jgi:hypothetical protein